MEHATGLTRRLGFRDQVYLLRVGFNEAGSIESVEVDVESGARCARIAAQDFGRQLTLSLGSGVTLENLAKTFENGLRIYPVRGGDPVKSASSHFDMIFQILNHVRPVPVADAKGCKKFRHLTLVPGGLA